MHDDAQKDPVLDALWDRVLRAWEDDKAHAAAIDHAVHTQRLPDLAGRYRALADDPEKSERAKKKLDAVVFAATQMLQSMKTPAPGKTPTPILVSAVAVCVALLAMLWWAISGQR